MSEQFVGQAAPSVVRTTYDASSHLDTELIDEADGSTQLSDYNATGNRTRFTKTETDEEPVVSDYYYNELNQLTGFTRTGVQRNNDE